MIITDYCSEYLRDAYNLCGAINGEYNGSFLYSIEKMSDSDKINKFIDCLTNRVKPISFDGGYVIDYKYKSEEGYIVIQSIYNTDIRTNLPTLLEHVAAYIRKIENSGAKNAIIIDNYDESGEGYHTFDISFIVPKDLINKKNDD